MNNTKTLPLKPIIIWTIVIFVILTLLTMKNEAGSDGFNSYGYPFIFYTYFSGKCVDCQESFGFKPSFFLLDILVASTIALAIVTMQKKLVNSLKHSK